MNGARDIRLLAGLLAVCLCGCESSDHTYSICGDPELVPIAQEELADLETCFGIAMDHDIKILWRDGDGSCAARGVTGQIWIDTIYRDSRYDMRGAIRHELVHNFGTRITQEQAKQFCGNWYHDRVQ